MRSGIPWTVALFAAHRAAAVTIVAVHPESPSLIPVSEMNAICDSLSPDLVCESTWPSGLSGKYEGDENDDELQELVELAAETVVTSHDEFEWSIVSEQGVQRASASDADVDVTVSDEWPDFVFPLQTVSLFERGVDPMTAVVKRQIDAPDHLLALRADDDESVSLGEDVYDFKASGLGVDIYMIDAFVRNRHSEFRNMFTSEPRVYAVRKPVVEESSPCSDEATHDASLAVGLKDGVAKDANILPVQLTEGCGRATVANLLIALNSVRQDHLASRVERTRVVLIPMSLSASVHRETVDAISELLTTMTEQGLVIVVPAGDLSADACKFMPALLDNVIAVGAMDLNGNPLPRSNSGECVDVWAPGESVLGASPDCASCEYARSGSSTSAAMVAGMIATYLQTDPSASTDRVRDWLMENAVSNPSLVPPYQAKMPPMPEIINRMY